MDEDLKETLKLTFMIVSFLLVMGGMLTWWGYMEYLQDKDDCNQYNQWGYVTEWYGSYGSVSAGCLIFMQDGTKLPLGDFKTMSIREPLRVV